MDYYNILGVYRNALPEEQPQESIQESKYATLRSEVVMNQTKEINEAYTALKDPGKRQMYDCLEQLIPASWRL